MELFYENWLSDGSLLRELACPAICLVEGDPIQAYVLARVTDDLVDVVRLGVLPESQGRGTGRSLLRALLILADRPLMLTVKKNNTRALRLYQNYNFEIIGELQDAWLMVRGRV